MRSVSPNSFLTLKFYRTAKFLYHDGGKEGIFNPINHKGIVHDVYWNQQYIWNYSVEFTSIKEYKNGVHQDEVIIQMSDISIYWFSIVIFESLLFFI